MLLYHTTPARNLDSIQELGILTSKCRNLGKAKIWLHDETCMQWAEMHTRDRHECHDEPIAHITVETAGSKVWNHGQGRFWVQADLLPISLVTISLVTGINSVE